MVYIILENVFETIYTQSPSSGIRAIVAFMVWFMSFGYYVFGSYEKFSFS